MMMRTPSKRRCSCRRETRTWTGLKPLLLVLCGSATKKKELCFVVGDVRRATSRAKCNEDVEEDLMSEEDERG